MVPIEYALTENIGHPDLFTGRKQFMDNFEHWVYIVRKSLGKSRALLSRRKKGKTVFMQRLYNIVWSQNDKVVPFFFEIKEKEVSLGKFAEDFLCSFLSQYYAFNTRKPEYILTPLRLDELKKIFQDDEIILRNINSLKIEKKNLNYDAMWDISRTTPHAIASINNIRVLQFLDEFQNINKYVLDEDHRPIDTLAGSYLGTAESKLAPLFVAGSYIGWLRRIIWELLPARFNEFFLGNLEPSEGMDMILKYAKFYEIPVTYETAEYIQGLTQGDPYYIAVIFEGTYIGKKDYTDIENINDVYEYEITQGNIKGTWLEYLYRAFSEVNDLNTKRIVLYLFNANGEERNREQIMNDLNPDMSDNELEKKLKALVYADIIAQGDSNFRYKVSGDKIYESVFRHIYQEEIDNIGQDIRKALKSQVGKFSYDKGHFYEYLFEKIFNKGFNLSDVTYNGDDRFIRASGEVYRNYFLKETRLRNMEIDIYGKTEEGEELLIDLKSGDRRTGKNNVGKFVRLKQKFDQENRKAIFLFFSVEGFTPEAEKTLAEHGVFYGDKVKYPVV
jgi:hypothetical protein